jgi:hypothetical protein
VSSNRKYEIYAIASASGSNVTVSGSRTIDIKFRNKYTGATTTFDSTTLNVSATAQAYSGA